MIDEELLDDDDIVDEEEFTYAVAVIRARETTLLNSQALENLMACTTYEESMRFLRERGWGNSDEDSAEEMLEAENAKTWQLIHELCKGEQIHFFDIFSYGNDFHNLKVAIKEAYIQKEMPNVYMPAGTVAIETIRKCAVDNDFLQLPGNMVRCAREAYDVLFHTGDSQLCDVIIDRAALEAIYNAGKESGSELMEDYVEFKCAAANINIALRACRAHKDGEFLNRAFVPCGSMNVKKLSEAARNSAEAIYDFLEGTVYRDAVEAIRKSPSAFDKWCDDRMMETIRPQKYNCFSISPLAAYVLARENEIKSVKIILTGKQNNLSDAAVRERIRDTYV